METKLTSTEENLKKLEESKIDGEKQLEQYYKERERLELEEKELREKINKLEGQLDLINGCIEFVTMCNELNAMGVVKESIYACEIVDSDTTHWIVKVNTGINSKNPYGKVERDWDKDKCTIGDTILAKVLELKDGFIELVAVKNKKAAKSK